MLHDISEVIEACVFAIRVERSASAFIFNCRVSTSLEWTLMRKWSRQACGETCRHKCGILRAMFCLQTLIFNINKFLCLGGRHAEYRFCKGNFMQSTYSCFVAFSQHF